MATLKDRDVREQATARHRDVPASDCTPSERLARAQLARSFGAFDGGDIAYVAFLTGASEQDMRRTGAL